MTSVRQRLEAIRRKRGGPGARPEDEETKRRRTDLARQQWETELFMVSLRLVRGRGPDFDVDQDGNFRDETGRLLVGPTRVDFAAYGRAKDRELARRKRTMEGYADDPPLSGRWEPFIGSERAEAVLQRLWKLAKRAPVPEAFRPRLWLEMTEMDPEMFDGPEQEERVRRLSWTLLHDANAIALLAELCEERAVFVGLKGGGGDR